MSDATPVQDDRIRLDKWLWYARFVKSRSLAARLVGAGHCRVNAARVTKPATAVGPGDVLTFPMGERIRLVRVLAAGTRRGPAPEAQTLYIDLEPSPEIQKDSPPIQRDAGNSRPTKRDRRKLDLDRRRALE
ncbi:RNA-binding S4 domain-containing protein [Pseudooceanicola sp.]|uniref:RNA-binding S4 domain-containing protein n=1 Tax=Pseudooceanicola sp. TaxID=1914328 RepID=UPI002636C49A|nr:RNA-binding S4 domain-containing protein [Pseudooceanicola sp.]MDF1853937.1 RNA-binding S4 domain-containing protein [Pseudooceanicola sp.]